MKSLFHLEWRWAASIQLKFRKWTCLPFQAPAQPWARAPPRPSKAVWEVILVSRLSWETGSSTAQGSPELKVTRGLVVTGPDACYNISFVSFSCSVTQSCLTFCNSVDCSTLGFPALHHPLECVQTHVHWVGDAIQPSHPLFPLLLLPSVFPSIRVFSNESALHIRWLKYWSINISLPMNIKGWFPLGMTDLYPCCSMSLDFSS